jgi:hypothetical protein
VKGEVAVPIPYLPVTVVGSAGTDWRGKTPTYGATVKIRF